MNKIVKAASTNNITNTVQTWELTAQYVSGSQPTSGGTPAAVQCFNPVQQLRSWRDELQYTVSV